MGNEVSDLVKRLAKSLRESPGDWICSRDRIDHKSGIRIWWEKKSNEARPRPGNVYISASYKDRNGLAERYVNVFESEALWCAIMDCESATLALDTEIMKLFDEGPLPPLAPERTCNDVINGLSDDDKQIVRHALKNK